MWGYTVLNADCILPFVHSEANRTGAFDLSHVPAALGSQPKRKPLSIKYKR
jgi:hypothetical protein